MMGDRMTMQDLQELLAPKRRKEPNRSFNLGRPAEEQMLELVPQLTCQDGFRMSVQASYGHYCEPRDSVGPWASVEVGFPSEPVKALMPYIDGNIDETDPTETVYGWVPAEVVLAIINDHGGLAKKEQTANQP